MTCALVLVPATAAAQTPPIGTVPVTGTVNGNPLQGTFSITNFARQGDQLVANGTLVGTVTRTVEGQQVTEPFTQTLAIPVSSINATCDILNLVLGPLHLELAGLIIDLNQVILTIRADQAGGLLGQLLGGLLCSTNPSNLLINVLNQILRLGR
jgi:hypothetical protein